MKPGYSVETVHGYKVVKGERPPFDLEAVPTLAYHLGKLYIKLKPALSDAIPDVAIIAGNDGIVRTRNTNIDALNEQAGANIFRPLFGDLYTGERSQHPHRERHKAWGFHLWFVVEVDPDSDIQELVYQYRSLEEVDWAEPVYKIVHSKAMESGYVSETNRPDDRGVAWIPDDPGFDSQWHYQNTGQGGGTPGKDISLVQAWDIEKGHEDVIVAIIDSGVEFDHPDLAANMWQNADGHYGYNWWNNSTTIQPGHHGTHVAGTVAAVSNNATGVAGIAGGDGAGNGIRLMSLQVFSPEGDASANGFHLAPVYAADNGAAISQNSWGYSIPDVYTQAELDAIDYFNTNGGGTVMTGGISIFSAGNNNNFNEYYPAFYSGTLAVAATNNLDAKAWYSNFGEWIDISAPGGDCGAVVGVLSTFTGSTYSYNCGTSMACPHVSGVAALLVSQALRNNYMLSAAGVWDLLINSTDDHYPENQAFIGLLGSGRLNAGKALNMLQMPILFRANAVSISEIELSWQKNIHNHDVMVVWNTEDAFGDPEEGNVYTEGDPIPGGGTVLYRGGALSYAHNGIVEGTLIYYRAYAYSPINQYSAGSQTFAATHIGSFPFRETFEDNSSTRDQWSQEKVSGITNWVYASGWDEHSSAYKGLLNARLSIPQSGAAVQKLVSPVYDLTGVDAPQLVFFHAQPEINTSPVLRVYYRNNPDLAWNQITQYAGVTGWVERVLDLPDPSATYQIAFEGVIPEFTTRPHVVDEVRIRKTPTCTRVGSLEKLAHSTHSLTLEWNPGEDEEAWNIKYGQMGFDPETEGTLVEGVDQNPYVLEGLHPGTYYEVYVQAECGPDDLSEWNLTPLKFITNCTQTFDLPYANNFNDLIYPFLPHCWERVFNTSSIAARLEPTSHFLPHSEPYHIQMYNGFDSDATLILISPAINAPLNQIELSFWLKGDDGYTLDVGAYSPDRNEFVLVETIEMVDNDYWEYFVSFEDYEGDANKIAFRHGLGGTLRTMVIDDVLLNAVFIPCPAPQNLQVSDITTTTAQLSWTAGDEETQWDIVFGETGFDPDNEGTLIEGIATNPYVLNPPLVHNTTYDAYIRAACNEFEISDWVGPVTFQTLQITHAITFSLDMSTADPWFNHNTEEVFISGNFPGANWDEPGSNNDMKLTRINPSSWLYTLTLDLPAGNYEYKYYRNAGWAGGEWAGGDNRSIDVIAEATQNDVWGGELAWANLQHPPNGAIMAGDNFNVYAQAFIPNNKTGNADPASGLLVWIGAHTENTDPATWPGNSWHGAFHNQAAGNNDEFISDLGNMMNTGGTYYYASRFQLGTTAYVYGGYNAGGGGFWDGNDNVSGVLEVAGLPIMTWLGIEDSNWENAGNWEDNEPPLLDTDDVKIATVDHQPVIQNHIEINNLTIQPGSVLSIAPSGSLTALGEITNNAGAGGLVLQSSAVGTGSLMNDMGWNLPGTVQRYVTGSEDLEAGFYQLVSVPLTNWPQPTAALFTGSYLLGFNVETQAWFSLGPNPETPLSNTNGYAIYYPEESTTYSFTGNLNNGNFMHEVEYHEGNETWGWNLVPNPYPSSIDWDAEFGWEKINVNNAIYIWNNGQYASYVAGGGTNGGTNIIAIGQSFFVRVNEFPFFQMDNQVRVHDNGPFLKKSSADNVLRIKAIANGLQDEAILRFRFDASRGYDSKYDAFKLANDALYPAIATLTADGDELSINSLPFADEIEEVELVFRKSIAGQARLEFENLESFASGSVLYLEDQATNQTVNLHQQRNYTFAYHPEENPNRFKLHFGNITGLNGAMNDGHHHIWVNQDKLFVHIPGMDGQVATVRIYDLTGREVQSGAMVLGSPVSLRSGLSGIMLVRVSTAAQVYSNKIIIR